MCGGRSSERFHGVSAVSVRGEAPADRDAVRDVLMRAFPSPAEATLVAILRGATDPQVALVAERGTEGVVGHILFTPVAIESPGNARNAMGLAPMAVAPEAQRQGIGAALVEAGLAACRDAGANAVVVLGHPDYYPRFGFEPAWRAGLYYGEPGPNPAFMVRWLTPRASEAASGAVRYHSAFDDL
jgi:putative acetyltransferase